MRARGTSYDPWEHAHDLGLTIIERRLRSRPRECRWQWGEYRHADRTIILTPGMRAVEARSTLTHEIAHALAGDEPTEFGFRAARQEARANRATFDRLLCPVEYADAERLYGPSPAGIAYALDVLPEVIESFQSSGARFWAIRGPLAGGMLGVS